jgi:hypothetical protein
LTLPHWPAPLRSPEPVQAPLQSAGASVDRRPSVTRSPIGRPSVYGPRERSALHERRLAVTPDYKDSRRPPPSRARSGHLHSTIGGSRSRPINPAAFRSNPSRDSGTWNEPRKVDAAGRRLPMIGFGSGGNWKAPPHPKIGKFPRAIG